MVNIKSSQRRSLFLLDPYYYRPRQVNLKFGGGRQYSPAVVVPFFFMVLAMYNYESIKRAMLPYSVQPNQESANTGREIFSPLVWEWHRYSRSFGSRSSTSSTTTDSSLQQSTNKDKEYSDNKRPIRLLIAQYVGPGNSNDEYTSILDASSPVNRAYAKMHGHDYVILRGIGLRVPWEEEQNDNNNRKPPPLNRASFNKLTLLQHALASGEYDQLLILDSDAILYDFNKDVTDFLSSSSSGSGCDKMVAGHKINSNDPSDTWHINNGVTLWNLRHVETEAFVNAWESRVKWWIWLDNPYAHSDQSSFYATMRLRNFFSFFRVRRRAASSSLVLAVENDFSNGTIVHVMRPDAATWIDVNVTSRVETIQKYTSEVCERYAPACENIDANP